MKMKDNERVFSILGKAIEQFKVETYTSFNASCWRTVEIKDNALYYCILTNKYEDKDFWNWVRKMSERCYFFVYGRKVPNDFRAITKKKLLEDSLYTYCNGKLNSWK